MKFLFVRVTFLKDIIDAIFIIDREIYYLVSKLVRLIPFELFDLLQQEIQVTCAHLTASYQHLAELVPSF